MIERPAACCGLSLLIVALAAVVLYRPEHAPATEVAPPPPSSADQSGPGLPEAAPPDPPPPDPPPPDPPPADEPRDGPWREPASPFTTVRAGECLEDVARRVYGRAEAVENLRAANRDLLGSGGVMAEAGKVLRTPPRPTRRLPLDSPSPAL